jgi:uncharacterized protein YajQ (UPF0234 family)
MTQLHEALWEQGRLTEDNRDDLDQVIEQVRAVGSG